MRRTEGTDDGLKPSHPEWCRVTLASIGDAVITTDTEGRVTFLNSVAESLTGWTDAEANAQPLQTVFNIVNQSTRLPVESPSVRALRDGIVVGLANHTVLTARDGTERPIDDSAAPIRDEAGRVSGVVLIFRDITERYRHEQELAGAADFSTDIIASLREPFVVLDRALRVRIANHAFYETFRATAAETEGHLLHELGSGQWDIPQLRRLLDQVATEHHSVRDFAVEQEFPGLGRKSMLLNARPFKSSVGEPDLILLAIEDVTARTHAESALQTSEVRYRRLFQTAKDGILILDGISLKVMDANPFMTDLLGYSLDELIGKELWEIGFFADKRASQAAARELREHGYMRYDHLPLETKTGQRAEVEFVCNTYRVEGRDVAQCNIRDISERTRMEKKIAEQAVALADLHRRKDEFLAMLSHELRNPLAPIGNAVQLLRIQPEEGPLQREARLIIERQMAQLTRLVDDLMEVSRISTGRVQLRLETVDMRGIVERAIESARPLIDRHHHAFSVTMPEQPVWLNADPARLEQVLVNLLNNAAKYTMDGGILTLSLEQVGEECVVRVRDTGVGIAPELLPRVFDLFTQAERSLDRSQGGLGIGLALVQRLVELHRGRIEAHSSLGVGSEFIVRMPVMPAMASAAVAPSSRAALPHPGVPLRVLVVDDNVDTADSLAMLLSAIGHDVRTAYTGLAGLEIALSFAPNAVLLDIGLPELDGYQVAKRIRAQSPDENLMLVAMTGYGQSSERQRSLESGFDHHLVKPADFTVLQALLATMVDRRTAH
ncbi:MAG TPA: PAS domain S-box protein [Gemmatimonadales bacterium]|nr:PAS domain S-box protein [Gemmatimonadales bacterium]